MPERIAVFVGVERERGVHQSHVVDQEKDDVGSLLRRGHQARQEKPAQEECLFHRIVFNWYKGKGSVFILTSHISFHDGVVHNYILRFDSIIRFQDLRSSHKAGS